MAAKSKARRKQPINVHAAKTHFSKLLARVEKGEEIVIARDGTPVAKLCPIAPEAHPPAPPGFAKGTIEVVGDINAPMDDEWLDTFYNGPVFPNESRVKEKP